MKQFQLNDNEQKVLTTLAQHGAMSPAQVAAETWILPGEMKSVLNELTSAGFVLMREDTNSPDGWLITITNNARYYLNGNLTKK